ncbi:MAG: hypothetical protein ACR2LC_09455 [Pyrinomonadaceae bacterium]
MFTIKIEGTEIPMEDDMCKDDETLKAALAPFYPAVTNADIKRAGQVITITKRAGSKGAVIDVVAFLEAAPEEINPALSLARRVRQLSEAPDFSLQEAMLMQGEIDQAVQQGGIAVAQVEGALRVLDQAEPVSSSIVPVGF